MIFLYVYLYCVVLFIDYYSLCAVMSSSLAIIDARMLQDPFVLLTQAMAIAL